MVYSRWIIVAAVLGMTGVAAGALGAHALRTRLDPDALLTFETAVRYQMYHALALLAVAWVMKEKPSTRASASAVCMLLGVLLFSGSLYGLVLQGWRWLGPVTPVGGLLLMAGWFLLALAARSPAPSSTTASDS